MNIAARLMGALFPRKCPLCGTLTDGTTARLCAECTEKLTAELALPCPICGKTAAACACLSPELAETGTPIGGRTHICAGFYRPDHSDSVLSRLIFALKRKPDDAAAQVLARLLARELMHLFLAAGEDIREWTFVYPPRTAEKRAEAGFDQAQRLARLLAKSTGAGYAAVLHRRGGQEQKQLSEAERRENVRVSLTLSHPEKCRGQKMILIDDVLTSGATMVHCAGLLREAGTKAVFCASVLKTLPRKARRAETKSQKFWFEE